MFAPGLGHNLPASGWHEARPAAAFSGSASTVRPTVSCTQANLVSLPLTWKLKMEVLFLSNYSQVLIELPNNSEKPRSETSFDITCWPCVYLKPLRFNLFKTSLPS